MNTLIILSITIFAAFFIKKLSNFIGIPIVTGYVLVGVLLGMSLIKFYHSEHLDQRAV